MKKIKPVIICIFLMMMVILTTGLNHSAFAQTGLKIMAEDLPPFNFEKDGIVQGISIDILIRIMEKSDKPIGLNDIEIMPWARGYRSVSEEPGTMLFSMARTEQREKLFQWVGPIYDLTIGLVAPKSKKIVISSMEDAKKYRIGTLRDGAPEQLLIDGGIDPNILDRIARADLNIKKLESGRIDLFAFNVPTTWYLMIDAGLNPNDYEVVFPLKQTALYYAFHKDTDMQFIEKLNRALEDLKKPGTDGRSEWKQIIEKYIGRDDE